MGIRGMYWQEQKIRGGEVQPREEEAVLLSEELEFESTAKESEKLRDTYIRGRVLGI